MSRIDALVAETAPTGVESKALGEVGVFIRGSGLPKSALTETGFPAIHYGQIHTHYGTSADTTKSFTDPGLAAKLRHAQPGDLIVVTTSEDDEAVAKATAWIGEGEVAVSGDAYIFRHTLDPLYAAYFFQTRAFRNQKQRHITGTKVRRVSGDSLSKIQIPVPPIAVQREIVEVLDRLSALAGDLRESLAKESGARRAQYLHYRHSLLDFSGEDSVRTMSLGDVVRNLDSKRRPVTRAARVAGEYPYYGANGVQDYVDNYIFDGTFLLMGEDGSVMDERGRPVLNWANGKIWVNNHAHVLVEDHAEVRLRYLFHYLQTADIRPYVTGGMQPKLNQSNMNRIPVSVPPVDQQDRIVAVMDTLEVLIEELTAELSAESEARRLQFEHYRERLFKFDEVFAAGEEVA